MNYTGLIPRNKLLKWFYNIDSLKTKIHEHFWRTCLRCIRVSCRVYVCICIYNYIYIYVYIIIIYMYLWCMGLSQTGVYRIPYLENGGHDDQPWEPQLCTKICPNSVIYISIYIYRIVPPPKRLKNKLRQNSYKWPFLICCSHFICIQQPFEIDGMRHGRHQLPIAQSSLRPAKGFPEDLQSKKPSISAFRFSQFKQTNPKDLPWKQQKSGRMLLLEVVWVHHLGTWMILDVSGPCLLESRDGRLFLVKRKTLREKMRVLINSLDGPWS